MKHAKELIRALGYDPADVVAFTLDACGDFKIKVVTRKADGSRAKRWSLSRVPGATKTHTERGHLGYGE